MRINSILGKLKWDLNKLPTNSTITFLNPYSYLLVRNKNQLNSIDFIGIDGGLLKTIINVCYKAKIERISFDNTSLAPKVFNYCIKKNKSIYFIGSTELEINKFIKILKKTKPELKITGFRNGYFKDGNVRNTVINKIINMNPDIVVAGMGTPFQENFILDLNRKGFNGTSFTCGGYFHQTTKDINYYPKFYNRYNIRWAYRIIDEPKLFKRYFLFYPKSLLYIFFDIFTHKYYK